ncbi:MAG: hypothetical protein DYH13_00225 [Alphaproteobacteria bacterium PRO2]|nr:hypothetical protein [Alphaproteobacteria bacterium PRO2]
MSHLQANLKRISDEFDAVQNTLYGEGRTRTLNKKPQSLYDREKELRNEYRLVIYKHFASASSAIPANVYQTLQQLNPDGLRINVDISSEIDRARMAKLPHAREHDEQPFCLTRPHLKSYVMPGREGHYYSKTAPALINIDKTHSGYHVCVSHIPGENNGRSPMNNIENIATEIRKELGWRAALTPVRFYIHVPPECGIAKESYMEVVMKRDFLGQYQQPSEYKHMDTVPAGIDQSMVDHGMYGVQHYSIGGDLGLHRELTLKQSGSSYQPHLS